jgi:hypothetical protein
MAELRQPWNVTFSFRPKKHVIVGFKICPQKNVIILNLACVHVHVTNK